MVTLLALVSCQEFNEGPELGSSQEDVTYQVLPPVLDPSGRISFANLVSFSDFVEKNADKSGEELVFFEGQFVSLRQKNEELAEKNPSLLRVLDEDVEEDPIIVDDFTASIVNEKREVMIDGKVVRYTEFGTWVYDDYFTDRVEQLLLSTTEEEIDAIYASHDFDEDPFYELEPGIFIFGSFNVIDKNQIKTVSNVNLSLSNSNQFNFPNCNQSTNVRFFDSDFRHFTGGIRRTGYIYFENNRRMKAKVWSTNYGTHSTAGYFTKLQRRTLGIWWASEAQVVSISVRANTYHPHPTLGYYLPLKLIPAWGSAGGTNIRNNDNVAKISFPPYTMTLAFKSGSSLTKQCKPDEDFNPRTNPFPQDSSKKLCKPTWKFSKRVKLKQSESCHFVRRQNQTNGEIRIRVFE